MKKDERLSASYNTQKNVDKAEEQSDTDKKTMTERVKSLETKVAEIQESFKNQIKSTQQQLHLMQKQLQSLQHTVDKHIRR